MYNPTTVRLLLEEQLLDGVEDWRRSQPKIPSRTRAIIELLSLALAQFQRERSQAA
jgi:hypothetical protein